MIIIITGPNENSPKASISVNVMVITGPNENSPKASISVNVMVANNNNNPDEVSHGKAARKSFEMDS